jgi:hypothetical protein
MERRIVSVKWHEITSPSDPLLRGFLAIYDDSFPIEVRVPASTIVAAMERQAKDAPMERTRHTCAAILDERVVGGAIFSLLERNAVGFISYIFVGSALRAQGIGEYIYRHIVRTLREDAVRVHRTPLKGVLCEVEREDPALADAERIKRIRRLRFFGRMGAAILTGLHYLQPSLHPAEDPLPMHLMLDPLEKGEGDDHVNSRLVLSWIEDIYHSVYLKGGEAEETVLLACHDRVKQSIQSEALDLRQP